MDQKSGYPPGNEPKTQVVFKRSHNFLVNCVLLEEVFDVFYPPKFSVQAHHHLTRGKEHQPIRDGNHIHLNNSNRGLVASTTCPQLRLRMKRPANIKPRTMVRPHRARATLRTCPKQPVIRRSVRTNKFRLSNIRK